MVDASPREVIERLESTHRRLRDALANTPASHFDQDHPRRRLIDEWSLGLHYEELTRRADRRVAGRAFKRIFFAPLNRLPLPQAGNLPRRIKIRARIRIRNLSDIDRARSNPVAMPCEAMNWSWPSPARPAPKESTSFRSVSR